MIFSKTLWFFTNEVQMEEGPFLSEEDAKEAINLYAKGLDENPSPEEIARYKELAGRWRQ